MECMPIMVYPNLGPNMCSVQQLVKENWLNMMTKRREVSHLVKGAILKVYLISYVCQDGFSLPPMLHLKGRTMGRESWQSY